MSLSKDGFLRWRAMKEYFSWVGKDAVESERLTKARIVGAIVDEMLLRSEVSTGSKPQ